MSNIRPWSFDERNCLTEHTVKSHRGIVWNQTHARSDSEKFGTRESTLKTRGDVFAMHCASLEGLVIDYRGTSVTLRCFRHIAEPFDCIWLWFDLCEGIDRLSCRSKLSFPFFDCVLAKCICFQHIRPGSHHVLAHLFPLDCAHKCSTFPYTYTSNTLLFLFPEIYYAAYIRYIFIL